MPSTNKCETTAQKLDQVEYLVTTDYIMNPNIHGFLQNIMLGGGGGGGGGGERENRGE